jgi:acyl phosphate:glycerol-3-phosphate acyltransferase
MNSVLILLLVIAVTAYFLGAIPFGLLISRTRGMDIRQHGSGNIGATNVWRVLGKKWGLLTFFCDAAKGWLAVWVGLRLAAANPGVLGDPSLAGIVAALGCIVGHSFPVWLGFKGGKGVATSLGVLVGMMPLASAIVLGVWTVVFLLWRYVSLASIAAALALPAVVVALLSGGQLSGQGNLYFACVAGALVVRRHRENITRLLQGTENRFGRSKPSQASGSPVSAAEDSRTPQP